LTDAVSSVAAPSRTSAPSRLSKSQARRQKYDRVISSRSTGSEATRVTPSSSVNQAFVDSIPSIPRAVSMPAEETVSR
jgi:hypothetical protein